MADANVHPVEAPALKPAQPRSERVPEDKAMRERLRAGVREHAARQPLVPPLTIEELRQHAMEVPAHKAESLAHGAGLQWHFRGSAAQR